MTVFRCPQCRRKYVSPDNAPIDCPYCSNGEPEPENPPAVKQASERPYKPVHPVASYIRFLAGLIIACGVIGSVMAMVLKSFLLCAILIISCLFVCSALYAVAAIIDLLQTHKEQNDRIIKLLEKSNEKARLP